MADISKIKTLDGTTYEIKDAKAIHNVYDGLDSSSTDNALSANMGRLLNSDLNANTNTKNSYNTAFDITIPSSANVHYYCDRIGRTVFIDVVFISSSAISNNTQIAHVDGLTGLMEAHASSVGSNGSGGRFVVGSYGVIKTERAIPANEWFSFTVVTQYNKSIN
jgi:hypothetical protein